METHTVCTVSTPVLGRITAALTAAPLLVLFAGCTPQTGEPPPPATAASTPARATAPITLEVTQAGQIIRATKNGVPLVPLTSTPMPSGKYSIAPRSAEDACTVCVETLNGRQCWRIC